MGFASSDEVVTYIGGIFKDAFADPEIAPKLTATGQVFRFAFTDPEATVCVDAPAQAVGNGTGQPPPAATMRMAAEVGNAYWQGKVNLPMAMAKGQILPLSVGISGANVHDSQALIPLVQDIPPIRSRRGRRRRRPGKLHGDKGYDYNHLRRWLRDRRITPRIARKGKDSSQRLGRHRWAV